MLNRFKNELLIVGDVHAEFKILNQIINKKRPKYVICLGDFGYWPTHYHQYRSMSGYKRELIFDKNKIKLNESKLFFIDGNHEDHYSIKKLIKDKDISKPIKLFDDKEIYYCPRGSSFLIDNIRFYCFGGALSIDRASRILGVSYFEEEIPNYKDVENMLNTIDKYKYENSIKILLSHTCSSEVAKTIYGMYKVEETFKQKYEDPTSKLLSEINERLKPNYHFFGHWHLYFNKKYRNTKFYGLNMLNEFNSYLTFKFKNLVNKKKIQL